MSLRWRESGELVCAAKLPPLEGDTYVDDRLHYQLAVVSRAVLPDPEEERNGLWHWVHGEPGLRATRAATRTGGRQT